MGDKTLDTYDCQELFENSSHGFNIKKMGNESSALGHAVVQNLEDETGLSPEEIRLYYKTFTADCKTSSLTIDEETFKKYYSDVFPRGDAASFAGYVFNALDKDGSGR